VVGATVTSALHSTNGAHGSAGEDEKRRALNAFIRTSGVFDAVADFDAATFDPATGELQAMFVPESTTGGAGDKLHPNRAGYMAMAQTIDLTKLGLGTPER
jgi:lysophospholipase L1-like esterase